MVFGILVHEQSALLTVAFLIKTFVALLVQLQTSLVIVAFVTLFVMVVRFEQRQV